MRKEGTKFSPSGYIPVQWEIKNLKQFANVEYGISDPLDRTLSKGIHIIGSPNVTHDGYYVEQPIYFVSPKKVTEKFVLQKDDILFNWRSGSKKHIGKTLYCDFDELTTHVGFLLRIRVSSQEVNSRYLDSYLKFIKHREYFEKSKVQVNSSFNKEELLNLPVVVPPLPEQQKIAEILSTWDQAIELVGKQIKAKQRLKKSLMQQLLTGKMRFTGFGKPVVGNELPEGWQAVRMCELGEHYSGLKGKSKKDFGVGKPYIPYLNIFQNNVINSQNLDYVQIENGENQNAVKKGDVFFTLSSETSEEVGMSSVLLEDVGECYLNSFCMGFRSFGYGFLHPDYAIALFRGPAFRRDIFKYAQGSTRFNLSKSGFMKMIVKIPDITEQRRIAEIFFSIDKEISNLTKKVQSLQIQKQGLTQKLLTGDVRVKV